MNPPVPQTISWNLTRLCNLECAHCYLDAGLRKGLRREELNTAQCLDVLEQIHAANPDALLILTGGEPLLRADLEQLVAHATELGLWVVLGSNGTLLTPKRAARLGGAGLKGVGISIDSISPGRHDRFRGKPGAWEDAVAGLDAAVKVGLDTVIQVSVNDWNRAEIPDLAQFALGRCARAVNFYFLVCTGRGQGQSELSPQAAEEIYRSLYGLQEEFRGRILVNAKCAPQYQRYIFQRNPDSPHLRTFQGGCPAATHYCRIDPAGEVTPCPYIPTSGGNLAETSFRNIWESAPVFRELRERERLGGRCGACEYQNLCSGCRARALADLGDLMAEDPFCAYQPSGAKKAPVALPVAATYAAAGPDAADVRWESEALESLGKIPPFVRGMVKRRMESYAAKNGIAVISKEMMQVMKEKATAKLGPAVGLPATASVGKAWAGARRGWWTGS